MGHRLTRIYTRTGDDGTTALSDGSRIAKHALRIQALGELDELNSHIGLVMAYEIPLAIREYFQEIQHLLFDMGSDISLPGRASLLPHHVEWLEKWLEEFNADLPPLREFILPGGNPAAACCHVARTVCRRVERSLVALAQTETVPDLALTFINRLSDFLFVTARVLARREGGKELIWQPGRPLRSER